MLEICPKEICTGCGACMNICAHSAIKMLEDCLGYVYPKIDSGKCIDCTLCSKICPVNHSVTKSDPLYAYAVYSKDEDDRNTSASGGASSVIASFVLSKGGIVYGSVQNSCEDIKCERIAKEEDVYKIKGSKYVQSILGNTLRRVKNDLRMGKKVLFTGTPCQISGLKAYLGKEYDNLYTIDLVCHGVPSIRLLKDNVNYVLSKVERKVDLSIYKVCFREKDLIKKTLKFFFVLNNNNKVTYRRAFPNDYYISGFMSGLFFRKNCFKCPYAERKRVSDMTIADFWGCKSSIPEMDENLGVSLVLVNTLKGADLFSQIKGRLVYEERPMEEAICGNGQLIRAFQQPPHYEEFQEFYKKNGYEESCKRFVLPYIKEQNRKIFLNNVRGYIHIIPGISYLIRIVKAIRRR